MTAPSVFLSTPQEAMSGFTGKAGVSPRLHGFGGLQGGTGLAIAVRAVLDSGLPSDEIRSIQARYERPIRDEVEAVVTLPSRYRTTATATAELVSGERTCVRAHATFGRSTMVTRQSFRPMPETRAPETYEEFRVPPEFLRFGEFLEIRPTTVGRPFAGSGEPHLQAWIRLKGDDTPLDLLRLVILLDALAPSAAAPMTELASIPTIELAIRPSGAVGLTTSPWMLLDARSNVSADGWVDEAITAWSPSGAHLGVATQLRVVKPSE